MRASLAHAARIAVLLNAVAQIGLPHPIVGQGSTGSLEHIVIPRLIGEIDFDGRVDEPAWEAVPVFPATMHTPHFGLAPSEATEFRVAHDERHLYVSCRAYDSEPSGVRASSLKRDLGGYASDWCILILDTFNDKETSLLFGTTPAGLRTDIVFANDTEAGANFNWNTFWDAAVSQDEHGWYAEIRIPFTSLRFQRSEAGVVMGLSLVRVIARKNEFATFPAISPQWGGFSPYKASQTREVVIRGARSADPLYVTPYGIVGRGYSHTSNVDATAYHRDRNALTEVGLDVKYGISSNLTLDLHTSVRKVLGQEQKPCFRLEGGSELSMTEILALPGVPLLLSLYFLVFLAFNFFYIAFPVHAATRLQWSLTDIGIFFSIMGLMMVVVQGPVLTRVSRIWPERTLVIAGGLVLAVSFLLFTMEGKPPAYAGAALLALGNGVMWPSLMAIISMSTGSEAQGAVQGLASSSGAVASIAGLLVGGLLYGVLGASVFVLAAVITSIAVATSLRITHPAPQPATR